MIATKTYNAFIQSKSNFGGLSGFAPVWMPDWLLDFQKLLVDWSIRRGRAAILADCGLGKTAMQLVWAENIRRKFGKSVLILTPLAVSQQTALEAAKFGIDVSRSQDGNHRGGIVVTNYERLDNFKAEDFIAVVCDEASILKSFSGSTRKRITRFMSKLPYRLLCTATAAPNDWIELGNLSEALGELSHSEMLKRFFRQLDDKGQKQEQKKQDEAEQMIAADPSYYKKLAYRVSQTIGQWRLKHHAVVPFWRWVASWARACRLPSDLGCNDEGFVLPPLNEIDHIVEAKTPPPGRLFNVAAIGMRDERSERRRTLSDRCKFVADLVNHDQPAVVWCQMNDEADLLEDVIPGAEQVAGATPDEQKIEIYERFSAGDLRVLVIKPKIGAFGLNWQHCNHVITFPSHSYEQYYQSVRRCWRFGQKRPVRLDVVATDGEIRVLGNMRKKAQKADAMFTAMVREMASSTQVDHVDEYVNPTEVPEWL